MLTQTANSSKSKPERKQAGITIQVGITILIFGKG